MDNPSRVMRVLIADDHAIFRDGLRQLLEAEADFCVVGQAADGAETVELVRQVKPDVLLLDLSMPRQSGLEVLCELASSLESTHAVILAAVIEKAQMVEAFRLGARGALLKESSTDSLIECIRTVFAGHYWMNRHKVTDIAQTLHELQPAHALDASGQRQS